MGNDSSLPHYDNDYELVVRVCKELEIELADILGLAENPYSPPLENMIDRVRGKFILPIIEDMFFLAETRNKLVHHKSSVRLKSEERSHFRAAYERVRMKLDQRKPRAVLPVAKCEDTGGMDILAKGVAVVGAIAAVALIAVHEENERKKKERF